MTITDKLLTGNEIRFETVFFSADNSIGDFEAERESFTEFKSNPEGPNGRWWRGESELQKFEVSKWKLVEVIDLSRGTCRVDVAGWFQSCSVMSIISNSITFSSNYDESKTS